MQGENKSLVDRGLFKIELSETGQAQRSDLSESFLYERHNHLQGVSKKRPTLVLLNFSG